MVPALRSQAESTRSLRISKVTFEPAAFHIEANSRAMAPAPIITADEGNSLTSSACVESMRAPANGLPGNGRGLAPVAMTMFVAVRSIVGPLGSGTSAL